MVFMNFSGGIDSTYYAWQHLVTKPNIKLFIHRINYYSYSKNRAVKEQKQTLKILEWFKSKGLTNFEFHLSEYPFEKYPRYDLVGTSTIAAYYMMSNGIKPTEVYLPLWHKELVNTKVFNDIKPDGDLVAIKQGNRYWQSINLWRTILNDYSLKFSCPHFKKTKTEMIREMPNDLLKLAWFCRTPKLGDDGICGKCDSCNAILPMLKSAKKQHVFKIR